MKLSCAVSVRVARQFVPRGLSVHVAVYIGHHTCEYNDLIACCYNYNRCKCQILNTILDFALKCCSCEVLPTEIKTGSLVALLHCSRKKVLCHRWTCWWHEVRECLMLKGKFFIHFVINVLLYWNYPNFTLLMLILTTSDLHSAFDSLPFFCTEFVC